MSKLTFNLLGFCFFSFVYSLNSYLLLLRDAFILERLSLALNQPLIESKGIKLAGHLHANSLSTVILAITFLGLFYFFIKLVRQRFTLTKLNFSILALIIITFFLSFPILSTDIFDYININRVSFVHQSNPWTTSPDQFASDSLIYFGSWISRASPYPPVTHILFAPIHFIFNHNIVSSIAGFKLLNLMFYLLIIFIITKIPFKLTKLPNPTLLFALNPLILIEFLGNAHNDIIMAFFALLSFYFLTKKKATLSGLALALGFLSKITLIIYAPIIILHLFNKSHRSAINFTLSFTFTSFLGLATLGNSAIALFKTLQTQTETYLRSLPTVVRAIYLQIFGPWQPQSAILAQKITTTPLFVAIFFKLLTHINKQPLINLLILTMIAYLLVSSPMLQPWYLIWFLPLVSLTSSKRIIIAAITFSLSSLAHYLVLFFSFYFSPLNFIWQITMYLTIALPVITILALPPKWYTLIEKKLFR